MNEKSLLKISLIVMILGLGFLFIYAQKLEFSNIASLDNIPSDETVKLKGIITELRKTERAYFLTVKGQHIDTSQIIVFPEKELFLEIGKQVEIIGDVENYKGKKELIANQIIVR